MFSRESKFSNCESLLRGSGVLSKESKFSDCDSLLEAPGEYPGNTLEFQGFGGRLRGRFWGAQRRKINDRKTWIRAKLCLTTGHHIPLRFFNFLCDYIRFFRLEGPIPLDYKGILGVRDRVFGV